MPSFLWGKILNHKSNFKNWSRAIEVIYFFLSGFWYFLSKNSSIYPSCWIYCHSFFFCHSPLYPFPICRICGGTTSLIPDNGSLCSLSFALISPIGDLSILFTFSKIQLMVSFISFSLFFSSLILFSYLHSFCFLSFPHPSLFLSVYNFNYFFFS